MKNDKQLFRKEAIKSLKSLSKQREIIYSHKINSYLKEIISELNPKSILFYMPLSFEPNILPLLKSLRRRGIDTFVPFIDGVTFKMVKFRLPLHKSSFGTLESGNSKRKVERVDIVIVPVIGIDRSFRRVGFGKGMYDRFYQTLKGKTKLIFVQNIGCLSREIITERHDIRADYYITPHLSLKIKDLKTNANRSFNRAYSNRFCHTYR